MTHALPSKEFARWSPEIQNTVPPQTSTVPETGPIGTCSGTEAHERAPDGTCSGTVSPKIQILGTCGRTLLVYQGQSPPEPVPVDAVPAQRASEARPQARSPICPISTELALRSSRTTTCGRPQAVIDKCAVFLAGRHLNRHESFPPLVFFGGK